MEFPKPLEKFFVPPTRMKKEPNLSFSEQQILMKLVYEQSNMIVPKRTIDGIVMAPKRNIVSINQHVHMGIMLHLIFLS